jgi:hypothetical protein
MSVHEGLPTKGIPNLTEDQRKEVNWASARWHATNDPWLVWNFGTMAQSTQLSPPYGLGLVPILTAG